MKLLKIVCPVLFFLLLSGFNFAHTLNVPNTCRYVDGIKVKKMISQYVTSTEQVIGWYLCGSEDNTLNDIQIAILKKSDTVRSFRKQYVKQNVNDAVRVNYMRVNSFHGAQAFQASVKQSTNKNLMKVDFYFYSKKGKTYALIYKDNHERYKTTGVQSRKIIAEILKKLSQQ